MCPTDLQAGCPSYPVPMTWHTACAPSGAMARPVPLWLALMCALAALCAGVDGGAGATEGGADVAHAAASGAAGGVTWLVQLSDLHLSAHAWPERRVPLAPARVVARHASGGLTRRPRASAAASAT